MLFDFGNLTDFKIMVRIFVQMQFVLFLVRLFSNHMTLLIISLWQLCGNAADFGNLTHQDTLFLEQHHELVQYSWVGIRNPNATQQNTMIMFKSCQQECSRFW